MGTEKRDDRRLEAFEMWIWRRLEKIEWVDRVRNEKMLRKIGEQKQILKVFRTKKKLAWTLDDKKVYVEGCYGSNHEQKETKRMKKIPDGEWY